MTSQNELFGDFVRHVPATEAKSKMAELLRYAEFGEAVVITRHGKPIAHLIPAPDAEAAARKKAVSQLRELRQSIQPSGISTEEILEWIREGRR
ncbi:MAG: type II toxin-antitoxin system prevent-host-death family antitoxin [Gammaproteobacteria bacterium]|nr:type II toxin-antitoxin system prevent-host-death family antitoxin [Gammaproteobacteria bacterium]